jgi:Na+/pantothenate symporter
MAKGYPTELRRAFLGTGALVFGGIGGAGAYYLMFGEYWILQTVFAIGGAWLAHYLVHQAMNRPSSSPKQ